LFNKGALPQSVFYHLNEDLRGTMGDVPVTGDFDRDGKTDFAVWRPSTGVWWIVYSSDGSCHTRQWGMSGDVPVPADYDRDGPTDVAVWPPFNPSSLATGDWLIINSRDGSTNAVSLGAASDKPVPEIFV
jgi:hypothetical protein